MPLEPGAEVHGLAVNAHSLGAPPTLVTFYLTPSSGEIRAKPCLPLIPVTMANLFLQSPATVQGLGLEQPVEVICI